MSVRTKTPRFARLGRTGLALAGIAALAFAAANTAQASLPPFCSASVQGEQVSNGELERLVSGTPVSIDCALGGAYGAPNWLVFETDGPSAEWVVQRLDASGEVVEQTVYASPDVIIPAGAHRVHLETEAPSVTEVLTRSSGLREEVARPLVKTLFVAEVRAAPDGTNVVNPQVDDLTERVATLTDIKSTVVHSYFGEAEAGVEAARAAVASLREQQGEDSAAVLTLERDLAQAEEALAAGQLDRVNELAALIQRFSEDEAQTASQFTQLNSGRMMALRLAVITGGIAFIVLLAAGAAAYIFIKRRSWLAMDDLYEPVNY